VIGGLSLHGSDATLREKFPRHRAGFLGGVVAGHPEAGDGRGALQVRFTKTIGLWLAGGDLWSAC